MSYSTVRLLHKVVDESYFDGKGRIKPEYKFKITIPELKILNSEIQENIESKFKSFLFLPEGESRTAEGGLRTKGYFKHSYKLKEDKWYICDYEGNILLPAPEEIEKKIRDYFDSLSFKPSSDSEQKTLSTEDIKELPLITVVTVVLNGAKYLEQTVQSVINQTYPNVEYIIIDGGSTDGTLDIIRKYEDYIDYWVSEKDRGIYDAMNKGIKVALGKWIGFLGSDDFYFDYALVEYWKQIQKSEFDKYEYISSKINLIKDNKIIRTIGKKWNWELFKKYMNVAHVGSLHSIQLFKKYGLFDINFKIAGDYELLLRPKSELKAIFLDKVTANMNVGGVSHHSIRVFHETELAKLKYTRRNKFLIKLEKYIKIIRGIVRRIIFHY